MKRCGLYIHIPFCIQKCAYCDFYSMPANDGMKAAYIHALSLHMRRISPRMEDICFDTVYIGGGTPGLLAPHLLTELLKTMKSFFSIDPKAEISMETNPAVGCKESLLSARQEGVNRLSIGLQSAHYRELQRLGRLHSFDDFIETLKSARAVGFENLSADLMYGIPEQSVDSLLQSVEHLCALKPTHISLYGLRVEPDTSLGRLGSRLILPDEDSQCDMYEQAVKRLTEVGYHRYEISNFARSGYACRHNLRYWQQGEYIGLGAAAHSFYKGVRYSYVRSVQEYINALEQGRLPPYDAYDRLTARDVINERVMLGLRLEEGIEADEKLIFACRDYLKGGFMWERNGRIGFTTKGFLVSNEILSSLLI